MEQEYIEEDYNSDLYIDRDLALIEEEYRKKRLIESLIGPIVSTVFHIALIIILSIFITDKYKEEIPDIEVKMEQVEEITTEEPPPVEKPEEIEEVQEDVTNPVLTTVALENVETNDAALEDVSDEAPSTEDDSTVEAVSDVTVSPSAFVSPSVFGGRSAAGRASAVSKFGGSMMGQQSLLKALLWLQKVQNPNGSWGVKKHSHYALTGLALLTFLAHGETQMSKQFGHTVSKAMQYLANLPIDTIAGSGYSHAIKTYAICEAYAMTGISILEDVMDPHVRVIIDGQQNGGSFGYKYNKNEQEKQDLSIAGWNYQALKAAYAAGCNISGLNEAIAKSVDWLKKRAAGSDRGYGYPYDFSKRKTSTKHSMRAVGVLCMQLFGEGNFPALQDEIALIAERDRENFNWARPPKESVYGWYYATQAMFQHGGKEWKDWNKKFQKELTRNQHPEGFWEYPGVWHGRFDQPTPERIYCTTLCALMLTVYYRYLPSTKGAIGNKKKVTEKNNEMEEEGINLIE